METQTCAHALLSLFGDKIVTPPPPPEISLLLRLFLNHYSPLARNTFVPLGGILQTWFILKYFILETL